MSVPQLILRDDHHKAQAQDIVFRHPTNPSGLQPLVRLEIEVLGGFWIVVIQVDIYGGH